MATKKKTADAPKKDIFKDIDMMCIDMKYVPEPTVFYPIGTPVSLGNLKDVKVVASLEGGKVYVIEYTSVDHNYGNPIITTGCLRQVAWVEIHPVVLHTEHNHDIIKNDDIQLNYSQRDMFDILGKAYHFGIDFDVAYQRDYVWSLEDKVALIDSMFNHVDIGKFVFIHREFKPDTAGYEILDGKQRVRAILDYYENRFAYKGLYYNDLTVRERYIVHNYIINIATIEERNLTEATKLRMFIMLNTAGKIMEQSHINKVKMLLAAIEK